MTIGKFLDFVTDLVKEYGKDEVVTIFNEIIKIIEIIE